VTGIPVPRNPNIRGCRHRSQVRKGWQQGIVLSGRLRRLRVVGALATLLPPSPADRPSSMVILLSEHGFHRSEQWISLLRL
jgi:hypothetical protein